jgi:glycosidase
LVRRARVPAVAGLLFALALALAPQQAGAAQFITWVAQQASQPTPGQVVRVWVNADTIPGETAGLGYNPVASPTYVKILGTYDTSGPPTANWRIDIPAAVQTTGAEVRYQLFVRDQSGNDGLFSGFNWTYSVTDIHWNGLLHDTFDANYRSPFGARPTGAPVTLRFRTEHYNVTTVTLRVYQLNADRESSTMLEFNVPYVSNDGTYDYWQITPTLPATPTIWYYKWKLQRGNDGINGGAGSVTDWYSDAYLDDHDNLGQGGTGTPVHTTEPNLSFQLTVYDAAYTAPAWMKDATVYQIFPDRFRNGDLGNDPLPNSRFFYGNITATLHTTWNEFPEDGRLTGQYNRDFFGGDLQGIINKLDYLKNMGVTAIYMTPIVQASSNHRYDTDNYEAVDPYLGDLSTFQALASAAAARGMHLILDGVYNHTSSDSLYFDRYHRYAGAGGCEALASFFRPWYRWLTNNVPCGDGDYEGWFGYSSLAVMDKTQPSLRDYIFGASNNTLLPPGVTENVTEFWYNRGAGGWRFDVADDATFHHDYWQAFRPPAKAYKSDGPLIGEIWPDASPWLLGDELDSVMNYRFRKSILGFARYPNNWSDNDNNGSNSLTALTSSQFDRSLKAIREDYAPEVQLNLMNLIDSHDTNRALYVLRMQSDPDTSNAKARLRLVATFQFTYLGAPTVYYGDEVGLNAESHANGSNGPEDDPYNRAPYPWADQSGYPNAEYGAADQALYQYYQQLGYIRQKYTALRTGAFRTLLTDDASQIYSFGRDDATARLVIALNNDTGPHTSSIPVAGYLADGTVLTDQLTGAAYTVTGGQVAVPLGAKGAAILANDATATLRGHVTIPGRSGAALAVPIEVRVDGLPSGSAVFNRTLDATGVFTVPGLLPVTVTVRLKNPQTLAVAQTVVLGAGMNDVTFTDPLREGDADDNNCVDVIDFSLVRAAFGAGPGDPTWDARTDFDGDGVISISDFTLLRASFGACGAP